MSSLKSLLVIISFCSFILAQGMMNGHGIGSLFENQGSISDSNYKIIIDPIESESQYVDSSVIYLEDPYISFGAPYRDFNSTTNDKYIISIKKYLQNVLLENVNNVGFKIVADSNNDPFKSSWFNLTELNNKPVIKIVYVKP